MMEHIYIDNMELLGENIMPKDKDKESKQTPSVEASAISSLEKDDGSESSLVTLAHHRKKVSWGDMSQVSEYSTDSHGFNKPLDEDISAGSEQRKLLNEFAIESLKEGQVDEVANLLKMGANPSAQDKDSKSLLEIVVQKQIEETKQKSSENQGGGAGDDSWVVAQNRRHERTDPNQEGESTWVKMADVILRTSETGYPQQSRLADPTHKKDAETESALQQAQKELPNNDALRGLLQTVADNRLLYESKEKHPHKVKKLLEGGANPNVQDIEGNSAY